MHMYHFEFIKEGQSAPLINADRPFFNRDQAKAHCRELYDKSGRAMGADKVCVREDQNPAVIYFWPSHVRFN